MNIVCWGTGKVAQRIMNNSSIVEQYNILLFIDSDITKKGLLFHGYEIKTPNALYSLKSEATIVILTSENSYYEIKKIIEEMNIAIDIKIENRYFFSKMKVLSKYSNSKDKEIKEIVYFLQHRSLDVFNYTFKDKYTELNSDVIYNKKFNLFYVNHNGRKLFFSKKFNSIDKVISYYRGLLIEQDKESPHKYLDRGFDINGGDIVIDAGAAEGFFSLDIIDKVSKVYLIECDDLWIEALKHTFEPYKDKVVIIKKYLSDIDDGEYTTLDSLVDEPVNFIKMDIEGSECDALLGAKKIMSLSKNIKCSICSYHRKFDEIVIKHTLESFGFIHSNTKGYMWFPYRSENEELPTDLRRGVVRAWKKD